VTELAERTAQLLALVLERSPRTIGELTGADPLAHDDVRAALDALERHGLVGRDRAELAALAEPAMRRLAEESGETVNVMVRSPGGAEAIAQVDGTHVLGVTNWIGREVPEATSAAGKVFLAFAAGPPPPALAPELDGVRRHGFATIVDELEVGLAAAAAPIRDADGAVVAALSVAGPTVRLTPPRLELLGRVTVEQAHAASVALGYAGALEDVLDALRTTPRPPAARP
jgi:IclR family acetate operon transcriptional repressor